MNPAPASTSVERPVASSNAISDTDPMRNNAALQAVGAPTTTFPTLEKRSRPLPAHTNTSYESATRPHTESTTPRSIRIFFENDIQTPGPLCGWLSSREAKLDDSRQDDAFSKAEALAETNHTRRISQNALEWNSKDNLLKKEVEISRGRALAGPNAGNARLRMLNSDSTNCVSQLDHESMTERRKSRSSVTHSLLVDGKVDMEHVHLGVDADSLQCSRTIPETAKSTGKSATLKKLLDGTIEAPQLRVRLPTELTSASLRERQRYPQCKGEILDKEGRSYPCYILFDTFLGRDLITSALIRPLTSLGKVDEFCVPESEVEYLQTLMGSIRLIPLTNYVVLPQLQFQHREKMAFKNKELYIINNEEEPFIALSYNFMEKNKIRLEDLSKNEDGSYLSFTYPQFNAGRIKYKKGKKASREDEEQRKKSQADYAEDEKQRQAEREAAELAREADFRSSTSTRTTSSASTGWSYVAASSQPTGADTDDDYQQAASNSQYYQQPVYDQYRSRNTEHSQGQGPNSYAQGGHSSYADSRQGGYNSYPQQDNRNSNGR